MLNFLHVLPKVLGLLLGAVLAVWTFGALYFDFAPAAAWMFIASLAVFITALRGTGWSWIVLLCSFAAVLVWWLALAPSHDRNWSVEYSLLPQAVLDGDKVTIRNVRNFDYFPGGRQVPRWDARTFNLADIEGIDLAINYWGSPWVAHPIVIFRFKNSQPLAFSIETRREANESYSALGGFFRRYELIKLAGDERDFLGGRAQSGEDIYLYATTATPERARARFLDYVETINALFAQPRWYHAVTSNCTTAIRAMSSRGPKMPFDWRLLINGKGDEMLYERGFLRASGLTFGDLKRRARSNVAANEAFASGDFSRRIRKGRLEFSPES